MFIPSQNYAPVKEDYHNIDYDCMEIEEIEVFLDVTDEELKL